MSTMWKAGRKVPVHVKVLSFTPSRVIEHRKRNKD
jgi:hypothetical protein